MRRLLAHVRQNSLPTWKSVIFQVGILLSLCTVAPAQNVQNRNEAIDPGMRSDMKVNPTTLGMELQIPLGHYKGRGGLDVPVVLSYSSKLWGMEFQAFVQGPPPPHGGVQPFTIVNARYSKNSLNGWNSSVQLPGLDFEPGDKIYNFDGSININGNCTAGCFKIDRMLVWMPDGSAHELRASDQPRNVTAPLPDNYYAVDGSRMRYQRSTATLFLPDGTRMVGGQLIDRNGNTLTAVAAGLRDTLGRVITSPLSFTVGSGVGDHEYTLPGVNGTINEFILKWRNLEDVLTTPEPLRFKGSSGCPPGSGGTFSPFLFASDLSTTRTCIGNSSELFNPVVLHQIVLPNGQSYTFTYNIYGEINKIVLPTGGYERFTHAQIPGTSSNLTGVYAQPNRGVTRHYISENGTDEVEWQFSKAVSGTGTVVTKIAPAPDSTKTESYLWGDGGSSWGYSIDNARAGRAYEERVYSSTNQLLRRKLIQWAMTGSNAAGNFSGTLIANRNARVVKTLEFILDTGGGPALAKTTTYGYDLTYEFTVGIDRTSVNEFAYQSVDQNTAQTLSIGSMPGFATGTRLRTTETDYLTGDDNYRSRNILGLITFQRIKDALAADKIVAQSQNLYDEYGEEDFPLLPYDSVPEWTDPGTFRGNVTSVKRWVNFDGTGFVNFPFGVYLATHTQYDQCGSPRKLYDARDTALKNPTLIDYSVDFKRAYPTTNTSADPDFISPSEPGPLPPLETRTEYDLNTGLVTKTWDENSQRTEFSYVDSLNRLTRVIRAATDTAAKSQTTYAYNDVARTVTVTSDLNEYDDNLLKTVVTYDGLRRPIETRQYESATNYISTLTEYDELSRVHKKSNPFRDNESPVWTTTEYDSLSRVLSVTTPDTSVFTKVYSGDRVLTIDQNSKKRISRTNALGQLTEMWEIRPADDATEPVTFPNHPSVTAGYLTNYSYDLRNEIIGVTQRIGAGGTTQTRTFNYDTAGRLISSIMPENGTTNFRYDNNGNLTTTTDSRSPAVTKTNSYDSLNRVTSRTYSDGTPSVTYVYDTSTVANAKGRLTSVSSSVSTYDYMEYDATGNILSGKQTTNGQEYLMTYGYDRAGNLKTQGYPSGRVVAMEYDGAGRLAGVQNQGGQFYAGAAASDAANRIQYSAHGAVSAMKLGNGLWEHTDFNLRLQPTQIGLGTALTDSSVLKLDYNYGTTANNGNLLSQTITLPGLTLTQDYTYDALNRLETAKEDDGDSWKQKFTYDRYGNRRIDADDTDTTPDLVGPNPELSTLTNRITAQSGEQYQYDGAGNLTTGRDGQTYAFDGENRMKTYNGGAGSGGADYGYDGDGKRVIKVVGVVTTVFVYDLNGMLVAEYSSAAPENNGTRYLTSDNLGSPRVVTDANQAVKARHDYHPFGEEIGLKGGRTTADPLKYVSDNVRQKFTSKERDVETGLDFFEARYYASNQGRFTSVDPLLESAKRKNPQSWNRYSYGLNNPYRFTDPDGENATENPDVFVRRTTTVYTVIVQDQSGGTVTQEAQVTVTTVKTELVNVKTGQTEDLGTETTATAQNTGRENTRAYSQSQLDTQANIAKNVVEVALAKNFDPVIALGIANTETRMGMLPAKDPAPWKQSAINPMQLSEGRGTLNLRQNIAGAIDDYNSKPGRTLNQKLQNYNGESTKVQYARRAEREISKIRGTVRSTRTYSEN